MFRKRAFWIGLVALLALVAGGGYVYSSYIYRPGQEAVGQTITTAQVRRGDLVVSVAGAGTLSPATEIDLGFQSEGYLDEVLVAVGDEVQEGDPLARLETDDLVLAVAEADIKARLAQLDLDDILKGPTDAELADASAAVRSAQALLTVARYAYDTSLNSDLDSAVRSRYIEYQWYTDQYWEVENNSAKQSRIEEAWDDQASAEWQFNEVLRQAEMEDLDAGNQVDQAQNKVYQAQEKLDSLQDGPDENAILQAEQKVDQATLALEDARDDLAAAELCTPFGGTVVDVKAIPGEHVSTAAFITLVNLEEPLLQFWVEESDMSGVAVGSRVEIIFEALPDDAFTGKVVRVDPALVKVDGTLAVQAWASVDVAVHSGRLLGGMNAEVEVISAESKDALLVPIQALRELGADQYAVFVMQPDGELEMRLVQVGLKDFAYAEILSGLESDDVVSTGIKESTETDVTLEQPMPPGGFGGTRMLEGR